MSIFKSKKSQPAQQAVASSAVSSGSVSSSPSPDASGSNVPGHMRKVAMPAEVAPKAPATPQPIAFEFFAPLSHAVYVAGTFNDWNASATPLARDKTGKWSVIVPLLPGSYEYRFVVDGEWKNDQQPVASVQNPFGSWNCVLVVSR
jgi:hypothetical protein